MEGEWLQRICSKYCSRLVVCDVHGRLAAAKVVVVHGGQIVMHERKRVDQFDRHGGRIEQVDVDAQALTGGVHEQRSDPFAAIENGIPHGFVQALGPCAITRQGSFERAVHAPRVAGNAVFELRCQWSLPALSG